MVAIIKYEDVEVGKIITNRYLSVDVALKAIDFDEQTFLAENDFDDLDYNEFKISY